MLIDHRLARCVVQPGCPVGTELAALTSLAFWGYQLGGDPVRSGLLAAGVAAVMQRCGQLPSRLRHPDAADPTRLVVEAGVFALATAAIAEVAGTVLATGYALLVTVNIALMVVWGSAVPREPRGSRSSPGPRNAGRRVASAPLISMSNAQRDRTAGVLAAPVRARVWRCWGTPRPMRRRSRRRGTRARRAASGMWWRRCSTAEAVVMSSSWSTVSAATAEATTLQQQAEGGVDDGEVARSASRLTNATGARPGALKNTAW